MSLKKLFIWCMTIGCIETRSSSSTISSYYGDISIEDYLQSMVGGKNAHLLLIIDKLIKTDDYEDNVSISTHDGALQLAHYCLRNQIDHRYFPSITIATLEAILPKTTSSTVIFHFRTQASFAQHLTSLAAFYNHCSLCQPFIILLTVPIVDIFKWLSRIKISRSFQAVLAILDSTQTSILHIHPTLDGCYRYSGIYWPKSQLDYARLKVPFTDCNLNAAKLNVSVSQWLPFCELDRRPNSSVQLKFSMESELLIALTKRYNFTANLIDGNDIWGILMNGSWTGMVGSVFRGESHFAMCGITRVQERLQAVDYSSLIYQDEVTYIMQSPRLASRDWIVAWPFAPDVWATILAAYLVVSLVATISAPPWVDHLLLKMYAVVMNQSIDDIKNGHNFPLRSIYAVWMLAALILTNGYSSSYYSILTVPEYEHLIDSLDELEQAARSDSHWIITWKDSSYLSQLIYSGEENRLYYTIGQHINRTQRPMFRDEAEQFVFLAEDRKIVLISSRTYFKVKHANESQKSVHVGRENVANYYTGLVLQKRSPLRRPFDVIIDRMQEVGLFEYWLRSTDSNIAHGSSDENIRILTLEDVRSVFILWIMGISLSAAIFIWELWFAQFCVLKLELIFSKYQQKGFHNDHTL